MKTKYDKEDLEAVATHFNATGHEMTLAEQLLEQNELLTAAGDALAFYGKPENYSRPEIQSGRGAIPISEDKGEKAREALTKIKWSF